MLSLKKLLYFYQKPENHNNECLKELKVNLKLMDVFDACILGKFPCFVKKKLSKVYNIDDATEAEIIAC